MSAVIHKHNWQKLSNYVGREWRCTSAKLLINVDGITTLVYRDNEIETGCLGTLVYWPTRKAYFFSAPGASMIETDQKPVAMEIDYDYIARAASYAESLRRLAA